jgi:hypothetical protein
MEAAQGSALPQKKLANFASILHNFSAFPKCIIKRLPEQRTP